MKYLFLAKEYDLVVGDTFELFYRGVICLENPYKYYILVRCEKGNPYPRYFTYTPKENEVGEYPITIFLIDDNHNVIDEATSILRVNKAQMPKEKLNVLCIGDSITFNGVWPKEGYRRFCKTGNEPSCYGFFDSLNFIGNCKTTLDDALDEVGYEGYGSWTWKSFCTNEVVSTKSSVWVNVLKHNLDENDQHSIYQSNGLNWVLESIEKTRLKFKRGEFNNTIVPKLDDKLTWVNGGIHKEDIMVESYEFENGNPFWNKELACNDFLTYAKKQNVEGIDLVYILLTWNGQYIPYNKDFTHHEIYAKQLIRQIHSAFPKAHISLLGIQICSVNGGIASNYGASGYYSDTFGTISTAFNYNKFLEEMVCEEEFVKYVRYIDTKAQFDSEYNMPMVLKKVNARSKYTEYIGTNGVHPTMDGYLQMGDVFLRALVKDVIEYNKNN